MNNHGDRQNGAMGSGYAHSRIQGCAAVDGGAICAGGGGSSDSILEVVA